MKLPAHFFRKLLLAGVVLAPTIQAKIHHVSLGESIQAAVEAASEGDTISVEKGTYQENSANDHGLRVSTNNLRLLGHGVTLKANGDQQVGVFVAPPGCAFDGTECASELKHFTIEGFTVEGFPKNGIQTRWVDGFSILRCSSIDNLNNGLYPTLSKNGIIKSCFSGGSLDSALWVAGSTNVRVIQNELTTAPTGLEITVSNEVYASGNRIHNNTVGVGLYHPNMAGNPPQGEMKNWVIENNKIYNNNFENTSPPGTFQSNLIPGFGVLLVGVSGHTISKNDIRENDSVGIIIVGFCTVNELTPALPSCSEDSPIADPSANNNLISDNHFKGNAQEPAEDYPLPASDIAYALTVAFGENGEENCFERNKSPAKELVVYTLDESPLPNGGCS